MGLRSTVFLFVLALGLTAWVLFFERESASWEGAGKMFPDLESTDIIRIEIERTSVLGASAPVEGEDSAAQREPPPPKIVLVASDEEGWRLTEPLESAAFLPRVQGLLWSIVDMGLVLEVPPESPAFAAAFGPDGPEARIRFRTRTGRDRVIEIGRRHPNIEKDFYARVIDGSEEKVVVTRAEIRDNFRVDVDELRSRAIVPVAAPDAVRFTMNGVPSTAKEIAREDVGKPWRFVSDGPLGDTLVDRQRAEELLEALSSWQVESFRDGWADDPDWKKESGLSTPRFQFTVVHRRGDRVVVDVGKTIERNGNRLVWLANPGAGSAFLAPAEPLAFLETEAVRLRSRFVLELRDDIVAVRCATKNLEYEIRSVAKAPEKGSQQPRDTGLDGDIEWNISGEGIEGSLKADRILLAEALAESRQILIEQFLAPRQTTEPPPLAELLGSVTFSLASGLEKTVYFERRSTEPRDAALEMYEAMRSTDRARFRAISRWPNRLAGGAWALADREVSLIDPRKVLELEVSTGDRSWVLGRPPGTHWSIAGDSSLRSETRLEDGKVVRLLDSLRRERFRVRTFEPSLEKSRYEELGIGTHRFHRQIVLRTTTPDFKGFRRLTLGYPQKDERDIEYVWARLEGFDVPVTLGPEVPALAERLVEHLEEVTQRADGE